MHPRILKAYYNNESTVKSPVFCSVVNKYSEQNKVREKDVWKKNNRISR